MPGTPNSSESSFSSTLTRTTWGKYDYYLQLIDKETESGRDKVLSKDSQPGSGITIQKICPKSMFVSIILYASGSRTLLVSESITWRTWLKTKRPSPKLPQRSVGISVLFSNDFWALPKFDPGRGRSPGEGNSKPLTVLLPGKFQGWRSLVGYSPWGRKESGMTEQLHFCQVWQPQCTVLIPARMLPLKPFWNYRMKIFAGGVSENSEAWKTLKAKWVPFIFSWSFLLWLIY